MPKVIISDNNKYRVIKSFVSGPEEYRFYTAYIVEVKFAFFYVPIKSFLVGVYDEDDEFCKNEAIELYHKIVNPYGAF